MLTPWQYLLLYSRGSYFLKLISRLCVTVESVDGKGFKLKNLFSFAFATSIFLRLVYLSKLMKPLLTRGYTGRLLLKLLKLAASQ